jgi:hypothetical protein
LDRWPNGPQSGITFRKRIVIEANSVTTLDEELPMLSQGSGNFQGPNMGRHAHVLDQMSASAPFKVFLNKDIRLGLVPQSHRIML